MTLSLKQLLKAPAHLYFQLATEQGIHMDNNKQAAEEKNIWEKHANRLALVQWSTYLSLSEMMSESQSKYQPLQKNFKI